MKIPCSKIVFRTLASGADSPHRVDSDKSADAGTAKDATDRLCATRLGRKIVSSPMPDNLTPIRATRVSMGTEFGRHGNRCLDIIHSKDEAGHWEDATDFNRNMVVTYRSKNRLPSSGATLALLGAGIGSDGTTLHLHTRLSWPNGDFTRNLAFTPRSAAFAVPQMDADIVLHIDPDNELDPADLDPGRRLTVLST